MADQIQTYKVSCRGGLDTNRDILAQSTNSPGSATQLLNYEPSLLGGYQRINGFLNSYGTLPGEGAVLGLAVLNGIGIVGARKPLDSSDVGYSAADAGKFLYLWSGSAWTNINTVARPVSGSVKKIRFTKYNWTGPTIVGCDGEDFAFKYHVDSSGSASYAEISTSPAPAKPAHASAFRNRLWLSGGPGEDSLLYYSAVDDDTDFTAANGGGVINVGFNIVAIKPFRDSLYIFGQSNIKKLSGTTTANFVVAPVTDDLGCIAGDSVVEIGGDLMFLAPDGIRPVSGTDRIGDVQLETVSKRIQSLVNNNINSFPLDTFTSLVIRGRSQFRYFFDSSDESGILGGLRENPTGGGMGLEFSTLLGLSVSSADSGYIGKTETVVHGDTAGKVYDHDIGKTFDGSDIVSIFQTPFLDMGDTEVRKILHSVAVFLDTNDPAEIFLSVIYDYEDTNSFNPSNFTIVEPGTSATFGKSLYDSTAQYDGAGSPVIRKYLSGSGKSVAFRFVTAGQTASHAIQGFVVSFGLGDKR